MLSIIKFVIIFGCFFYSLSGQGLHLLLSNIGDGAYQNTENGEQKKLKRASFLPLDSVINIPSESGIETLVAGFQFRFGFDTSFTLKREFIDLHRGSILIQSRKLTNKVFVRFNEHEVSVSGVGTCMLELGDNGALKLVGILGRIIVGQKNDVLFSDLLAGDMIVMNPKSKTIDEKKSIDLSSVVETSFLISGFPNSTTFKNSIESMVHAQNQSSISQDLSSEIDSELTVTNKNVLDVDSERVYDEKDNSSVTSNSSYSIPDSDPLRELLGRDPIRSSPGLIKEEPKKSILKRLPGNLLRSGK